MSSYKEPPIVTAYGIQIHVTKPASFIDDSFRNGPDCYDSRKSAWKVVLGSCYACKAALIGEVAVASMKTMEATWQFCSLLPGPGKPGAWTSNFNQHLYRTADQ